ncbi:MAG TPA: TrkA C-terminal domain-containing protein [Euzebyales bacterium]|nr:TrkA C-terminal domain-containing protein [Euzebyales bacterium]
MDISIREHTLPGIGRRYDVTLGDGRRLSVIIGRTGFRELSITDGTADEPSAVVALSQAQALAVAALLSGARFSLAPASVAAAPEAEEDVVTVNTVTLTDTSPAIGHSVSEIELPAGSDAAVLAVIRDQTPELVEDPARVPCEPGDRLVVAARAGWLRRVTAVLAGG